MSSAEARRIGWGEVDVVLVTGDTYVDHPSFGAAIVGRVLVEAGYRVGVVAQPDWRSPESLRVFGQPRLAFAVTSGNLDSMLNLYTAARRLRHEDAYAPGGRPGLRPPRALTVYANLARAAYPKTPVILGGIEASMRRLTHYDYWQDRIRPSVLLDTKAELLIYGMGERAVAEALGRLAAGTSLDDIPGTAVLLGKKAAESVDASRYVELPSYDEILKTPGALMRSHLMAEQEMNPSSAHGILQRHGDRLVRVEAPAAPLDVTELDAVYRLPFSRRVHHSYTEPIPAHEMIKDSVTALRGCPGGCSFCGLGLHQGKFVTSRSMESVVNEVRRMLAMKTFTGVVSDVGGPTANAYGCGRSDTTRCATCRRPSCLFPEICGNFHCDGRVFAELLDACVKLPGVKKVFVSSGLRLDLAVRQKDLTTKIIERHTPGRLKVAPEHLDDAVLRLMRKSPSKCFWDFLELFRNECRRLGRQQTPLIPYFIANFPGADEEAMRRVDRALSNAGIDTTQSQDFIPLPMTIASAMYYEGKSWDGAPLTVRRGLKERRGQLGLLKKRRS